MGCAAAGVVSGKDVVKKLRARPDLTRRLHMYQEQIERVPLMGVDILPLELGVLVRSADVRRQYALLVNDSLVVTAARELGIESLASAEPTSAASGR